MVCTRVVFVRWFRLFVVVRGSVEGFFVEVFLRYLDLSGW